MIKSEFKPKVRLAVTILAAALLAHAPIWAAESLDDPEAARQAQEAQRQAREQELRQREREMIAAIEETRMEANRAAEEARLRAERLRAETERLRAESDEMRRESGEQREEQRRELARVREEISRTHRELRRASQEVAKAHRDLAMAEDRRIRATVVNLGDRAMLGVILGGETLNGIKIVGISPDGPAERAGLKTGDVLASLGGISLSAEDRQSARERVYEVMTEVDDGEEISVTVIRNDERLEFMITPEKREPASWATYIELPLAPDAPGAPATAGTVPSTPAAPAAPAHVSAGHIAVPPINVTAVAAEAAELAREFELMEFHFDADDLEDLQFEYSFDFDPEALSEMSAAAMDQARIVFGSAAAHGIRFAELNPGLGQYFDTQRGLLVLDAAEGNAFGLKSGDVLLAIGDYEVNSTSDIIRALRDYDAGDPVSIDIKRNQRDETLDVLVPENRYGLFGPAFFNYHSDGSVSPEIADG